MKRFMVVIGLMVLTSFHVTDEHICMIPKEYVQMREAASKSAEYPVQNDEYMIEATGLVEVQNGEDSFYYRKVHTAVCSSDKCYPVKIILYWDLLGSFIGYELPPGEKLTKVDHEPFTNNEYEKLLATLKDPYSRLRYYDITELVSEDDEVDGVSGATNTEVVNLVVEGAVYTFYTLWRLVNGDIPKKIKSISAASLDKAVLEHWMQSSDGQKIVFAIKTIQERALENDQFFDNLYKIFINGSEETSNFALRSFPDSELQKPKFQQMLANDLPAINFSRRSTLYLKLLNIKKFENGLTESLATLLATTDDWQRVAILNILLKAVPVSGKVQKEVEKLVGANNQEVDKKARELLRSGKAD